MKKLKELYEKYEDLILYVFFGVCTTVVNIISYNVIYYMEVFPPKLNNIISDVIAWFLSVVFAYITNRKWVFKSKVNGVKNLITEIITFFSCRLTTGIMDFAIMYICVDIYKLPNMVIKIMSNVLVIVLNYVGSKLIVFKNKEKTK